MINIKYKISKYRNNVYFSKFQKSLENNIILPPIHVIWDATRKCNLNCIHCGASRENYDRELTTDEVKDLINQLSDMKVKFFSVTGGEALVRKDLLDILHYAYKKGIKTGLASNGFLINEKIAKKISDAKVSSVQISIDGTKYTHNKIRRNKYSFQKAVSAIGFLQKLKVPMITVSTTITPINLVEINQIFQIIKTLKVNLWKINIVMPIGRAEENELLLRGTELSTLLQWVANHKREFPILISENLTYLADYEEKIRDRPYMCPVGFTTCCIGVSGHVRGCPEQPDTEKFREGSILEKPFKEIWNTGFKRYRNRQVLKTDPKCVSCKHKFDCYGGCWVMRESKNQCIYELLKN